MAKLVLDTPVKKKPSLVLDEPEINQPTRTPRLILDDPQKPTETFADPNKPFVMPIEDIPAINVPGIADPIDISKHYKPKPGIFENLGVPEILQATKGLISPTDPYMEKEHKKLAQESIYDRFKWALTYAMSFGGRVGPKGLREDLLRQAEKMGGYGPAIVPVSGEVGELALEWGVVYPALFKAVGVTGESVSKLPKVAKAAEIIKKVGGLEKFAEKFPRAYAHSMNVLKAFSKGFGVGTFMAGAETIGKDMEAGEILQHTSKRGVLVGGITGTFQLASEIDTARYVSKLRNTLIRASNQRFDNLLKQVDAMPNGPRKSASYKGLSELKTTELKSIDRIVSTAEGQLLGLKKGKMYQLGQESVESPQGAAERFIKYGNQAKGAMPKGVESLKVGMGKSESFIKMPMTRVAEAIETSREIGQIIKHPAKAFEALAKKVTMPKVPTKAPVTPPITTEPPATEPIAAPERGVETKATAEPTITLKPDLSKPKKAIEKGMVEQMNEMAQPTEALKKAGKKKTIEELQAEIDSYLQENKSPPTELLAEINAARRKPQIKETLEPPKPKEGPNILMLTEVQKRLDEKAMLSKNQKLRPGARRLAKQFIGKTDLRKMTGEELSKFGQIISKLPEPTYNNKGQRIPPSIPKTTAITKAGEFEKEYTEPTFMRMFHAPEYYAEKLGVKSLVEKAEAGKTKFSLEYQELSNKVDKWVKKIEKLGRTSIVEKTQAKLKNLPTKASARFRELLDTHEEPPDSLNPQEKELFNNFRELSRWLLKRENAIRESLELEPIKYRKAYVRHVARGIAKEMLAGRYPFPQGRKFWAEEIIAKKIYNPMEMHRTLTKDIENIFSKDLGFATKSMLWTALKEIHLSQPIRYLEQQLTAKGKDTPVYKNLSPSEQARWDKVATIPSRTRRWVKDYVNTTIKGQQSWLDQDIEAIVKKTGLNGLLNKLLAPFGRALSHKPVSNFVTEAGRMQILGVMGWRPKQIIRNKFQTLQNMALYPLYKETWRTYAPIRALRKTTPDLERLLDKSLFLKAYTGTEEWPVDIKSKIAKAKLADFQWSAITNARQSMEAAYWGMLPLFNNPKFKHYGWADPKRTYKEKPEFLYPSEEKLMLKEMEFGAAATQHNYTPIGMPEIFRHKTLTPITRLQSWWMNHYFRFTEEALRRGITGKPTYSGEGGPTLPWKYRLGWLRYLLIAVPILNTLRYQRSYLFGAAPTGVPPFAQFVQGMYNYVIGKGADNDQQWKKGKKQMIKSGKTFIPGYMTYKDWEAIWSGRKDLSSLFFYKKRQE